ncbi:hypothetical protein [Glaciecola sp. SC05]|uniref:hypothetical protein n=1 Tax=Glaciecola sp. SC05 TaxID=1987355 RepID=UPI00352986F4
MALKLTRKSGESVILKYSDTYGLPQKVRILLRKIKRNGDFELDYQSSVGARILSSSGLIQAVKSNENLFIRHGVEDVLLVNVSDGVGSRLIVRFGVDNTVGSQFRMWFDAPEEVKIIRDELENAA